MRGNARGLGVFSRPGANAAIMDKSDGVREGYLRTPGRMKADPDRPLPRLSLRARQDRHRGQVPPDGTLSGGKVIDCTEDKIRDALTVKRARETFPAKAASPNRCRKLLRRSSLHGHAASQRLVETRRR